MRPTYETNFCRVFEFPETLPEGFCFGGGISVQMKMVDWFNPWPQDVGELRDLTWSEVADLIRPWLLQKTYIKPGRTYVLVTDFGEAMVVSEKKS